MSDIPSMEYLTQEAFGRAAQEVRMTVTGIRQHGCIECRGPLNGRYLYCSDACSAESRRIEAQRR